MLHPTEKPRVSFVESALKGYKGPFVAASDYVRALPEQLSPWVPGGVFALGTDGMGRSETREALRRHFEVDAPCIVVAALYQLHQEGKIDAKQITDAIKDFEIDPEKVDPYFA